MSKKKISFTPDLSLIYAAIDNEDPRSLIKTHKQFLDALEWEFCLLSVQWSHIFKVNKF